VGPNCAPSRASLMTGLYPPRHGIYTVGSAERGNSTDRKLVPVQNETTLASRFTTIAEKLNQAGYKTSLIGKWQLGNKADGTDPSSQGFEHVVSGAPGTSSYFFPYFSKAKSDVSPHLGLDKGSDAEYLTDRLTDEAIRFMEDHREKPFFLYLSYFAVHTPIHGKSELVAKYKSKKGDEQHNNPEYAAMMESVDQNVGRLMATLEKHKLAENTVVVFYSDNGGMGAVTSQLPLRGSKGMLYEGGIRVPLLVRWSNTVKPGVTDYPVIGVDFFPTFLELANQALPTPNTLDGRSFAPLLLGKSVSERDLFWHFPAYLEAYKRDRRNNAPFRTTPVSVIRSGDWKLMEFYEDGRKELYHLKSDLGESRDLSDSLPENVERLSRKLVAWRKKVAAFEAFEKNTAYRPTEGR
jgi:arylsulfatase A-like enzyme